MSRGVLAALSALVEIVDGLWLGGHPADLPGPVRGGFTPKEATALGEEVSGHFEGVGMNFEQDRRCLKVLRVFDGSPAEDAGIRRGDFILGVNGRSIAGVNSEIATG